MKMQRMVIGLGGIAAAVIVILVLGALLLPWLIDSQLVKEKIASVVVEKTNGTVTLGKIDLLWFPRPAVLIQSAEFSLDEKKQGTIQSIKVYPSIFYLLAGRLVVRRVQLQAPQVKVHLPAPSEQPLDIEELEMNLRSALTYFTTELPGLRIDLSDGSAEIEIGDKPPVTLQNVAAQAGASSKDLRFQLSARSNLCNRLRIEGKMSGENLAAQFEVAVDQLKVRESLIYLPQHLFKYAQQGEVSFNLDIATLGLRKIKAQIDGSVGALVLARRGGKVNVKAKRLKGNLVYEEGSVQAKVEQLDLVSPRLRAAAELKSTPSLSSARIKVRDVNVGEIRDMALRFADDVAGVKKFFQFIQAGTIAEMVLQSSGRSFKEMARIKNIAVSGSMRNGSILVPGPELDLRNVTGSVRISGGVLEAKDLTANLGTTKGSDGKFRLGLEGKNRPFHLDIAVQTGAAELQSVLLKLLKEQTFRRELLKVRNLEGVLSGRLILGERLDAIAPVVSVLKTDISATYDPVPFPVAIRGGRFNYDPSTITLENVQGSVGRSAIEGLNATLQHDRSRRIKIDSARVSLDLEQAETLLRGFQDLRSHLVKLRSARGKLDLGNLTLTGALDDPAGWNFKCEGTVKQVTITHADLPAPLALSHGKFAATQAKITFSDAAVAMMDASLVAGGVFENTKGDPLKLEASGTGIIGEQMIQWLSRQVELPKELLVRSPLKIAAGRIDWRGAGDIFFRGQVTVAGGPQISVDAERHPQSITVRDLIVEDGGRRARIALQLAKDNLDLSFEGALGQQTLNRIFASFPSPGSALQGNIQVSASLRKPNQFSARGQLEGSNLLVPLGQEKAVVERFRIEAGEGSVLIRSADLRWRNSRFAVSGKVSGEKEALRVDMDVFADRLNWEELNRSLGGESGQQKAKEAKVPSLPPVEGTIRLKTDSFTLEGYKISPLKMTAGLSSSGIKADIDQAVACGITATGRVDIAGKQIDLDVKLAATEAQLEPTSVCLTDRRNDVKGIYSFKGRITGRGDRQHLLSSLKGDFELSALDGEFVRSSAMDATFDYLNTTGDFKVVFPDLNKETFPFRLVSVKGRIDGETLVGDEIIVQSSLINLSGQGKIDLARKQVDGKGLIAVLKPVDEVISRIPVVGSLFGGSIVGIPVRVAGSLDRPEVTYLSPADVGTELLNMPLKILGIPLEAIKLFAPSGQKPDQSNVR